MHKALFCLFISLGILCCFGLSDKAAAQDAEEFANIQNFDGGSIEMSLRSARFSLLGPGGEAGGSVAPVFAGPQRHLQNPALLGMCRRPSVRFDFQPGIVYDPSVHLDLNATIAEGTEDALRDQMAEGGSIQASTLATRLSQWEGTPGSALHLPLGRISMAISMDRPLYLDLSAIASGLKGWAEMEKETAGETETIMLRADLDLQSDLCFDLSRYSVGLGSSVGSGPAWLGFAFDLLAARASLDASADIEGIMSVGGRNFIFDDPADSWENSLDQSAQAAYAGLTWGLRAGAAWQPSPWVSFGLAAQQIQPMDMAGGTQLSLRRLAAWDGDGIDPTLLSLSQPTETVAIDSPVDDHLMVSFPGSIAFGSAISGRGLTATFDWRGYWGNFAMNWLDADLTLLPRQMLRLGLHAPYLHIGAGVLLCDVSLSGPAEIEETDVPLPLLSIGLGGTFFGHLNLEAVVEAAPLPSIKLATGLDF